MDEVLRNHRQIIEGALARAARLEVPGVEVEFETLPPITERPQWGMDVVKILLEGMKRKVQNSVLNAVLMELLEGSAAAARVNCC